MNESGKAPVLELVWFVLDWRKIKTMNEVFHDLGLGFPSVMRGMGTASSETLDILGIGSPEKAVVISLDIRGHVPSLLLAARDKLKLEAAGAGIGFSVPLAAINASALRALVQETGKENGTGMENETGEENTMEENPTSVDGSLIVAILNQGYSDEFMACARKAGAGGGTIINARGMSTEGREKKFFGITVQNEREIIIILSSKKRMRPIMEAVSREYGVDSKAEGRIFSLPIDNVIGLDLR